MMAGVAIVTGGGSGIGAATARALVDAGWSVAVIGRRRGVLDQTCASMAGPMLAIEADVTDEAAVVTAFDAAIAKFGRVDLLSTMLER